MRNKSLAVHIMLLLGLAACGLPLPNSAPPPNEEQRVNTAAAQTVQALSTEIAGRRSATPDPNITPSPTITPPPGAAITNTPEPGITPEALPTVDVDAPCLSAEFVRDVTIPDGTSLPPGTTFTKIWEIKNTGSCPWTSGYQVVFSGAGDAMGSPAGMPLLSSGEVHPGTTVQIAISLLTPASEGDYKGNWLLRSDDNQDFGVGEKGTGPIYAVVHVTNQINFAELMCSANWSTAAGTLPCDGDESPGGFAQFVQDPILENDEQTAGMGILVSAQPTVDGYVVGQYPPIMVPPSADFRATLSCRKGVTGCYVRFRVAYQIDGGIEQTLAEWNEGADGNTNPVAVDLDTLAGKNVAFKLYVMVNGAPESAQAIWLDPRIIQQ